MTPDRLTPDRLTSRGLEWLDSQLRELPIASGRPLRLGIMVDSDELIGPFAAILEQLSKTEWIRLSLVIHRVSPELQTGRPAWLRFLRLPRHILVKSLRDTLLFRLFFGLDSRFFSDHSGLSLTSIRNTVSGIPRISVKPRTEGYSDWFSDADVAAVESAGLDVILRFGFRILRGEILLAAKEGIWSFHHGDNKHYRGAPPCFWEMFEGSPTVGVILQKLNSSLDNGHVIKRGYFSNLKSSSLLRNRIDPYWSSSHFVLAALRDLMRTRGDTQVQSNSAVTHYKGLRKIYKTPKNLEFLGWFVPHLYEKLVGRLAGRTRISHWRIGLAHRSASNTLFEKRSVSLKEFKWFEPPKGKFWADPFLVEANGSTYLFFEEYDYARKLGAIACCVLNDDLTLGPVQIVLSMPFHLSFPHVFEHGGKHYMLPEASESGGLTLFEAEQFPWKWRPIKTILPISCVDPIAFFHGDHWWLHTALRTEVGPASIAVLFYSKELTGEWILHPDSPTCVDYRNARNAGSLIKTDSGKLFRVSQSSESRYGSSFAFHLIEHLDTNTFKESLAFRVVPDQQSRMRGTHTYSECSKFIAVDGVWDKNDSDAI